MKKRIFAIIGCVLMGTSLAASADASWTHSSDNATRLVVTAKKEAMSIGGMKLGDISDDGLYRFGGEDSGFELRQAEYSVINGQVACTYHPAGASYQDVTRTASASGSYTPQALAGG